MASVGDSLYPPSASGFQVQAWPRCSTEPECTENRTFQMPGRRTAVRNTGGGGAEQQKRSLDRPARRCCQHPAPSSSATAPPASLLTWCTSLYRTPGDVFRQCVGTALSCWILLRQCVNKRGISEDVCVIVTLLSAFCGGTTLGLWLQDRCSSVTLAAHSLWPP